MKNMATTKWKPRALQLLGIELETQKPMTVIHLNQFNQCLIIIMYLTGFLNNAIIIIWSLVYSINDFLTINTFTFTAVRKRPLLHIILTRWRQYATFLGGSRRSINGKAHQISAPSQQRLMRFKSVLLFLGTKKYSLGNLIFVVKFCFFLSLQQPIML